MSVFHTLPENWVVPKLNGRGNGPYGLYHLFRWRLAEKFTADTVAPERAQKSALDRVLDAARGTEFGAKYGLETAVTYREFADAVPVHSSQAMEPYLARVVSGETQLLSHHPIRSFVKTSGTTGAAKLIPVTDVWARAVQDAQTLWLMGLLKEYDGIHKGKALTTLGASVEGMTNTGVPYGSNTGRIRTQQPWYLRHRWGVPSDIADISDPLVRHYAWLRHALPMNASSWTTANPSMVLAMCRRFSEWEDALRLDLQNGTIAQGPAVELPQAYRARWEKRLTMFSPPEEWRLSAFWNLKVINCWTQGPAHFFAERVPLAFGADVPVRDVGFQASEGVFAIPLHSSWNGGVAWVGGHLLELKCIRTGRVVPVVEGEKDQVYSLIVSTTAGLYRYDMHDCVRVVGRYQNTPVLQFLGKGSDVSSIVGEKVTGTQVWMAFSEVLPKTYMDAVGLTVCPGDVPQYVICMPHEPSAGLGDKMDLLLQRMNVEYASKRASGRLQGIRVCRVPQSVFAQRTRTNQWINAADGQRKDDVFIPFETVSRFILP